MMRRARGLWLVLAPLVSLVSLAAPLSALTLAFPGNAQMTVADSTPLTSMLVPTGPAIEGRVPGITAEGALLRQVWRVNAPGLTSLQIMRPLREQLQREGYDILYECETDACGGFDFRFGLGLMGPPEMYVDLGDFRFLAARFGPAESGDYVSLMVSRSSQAGFVHVSHLAPPDAVTRQTATGQDPVRGSDSGEQPIAMPGVAAGDLAARLESAGHVVLADLTFETGSARLGPGPFAALDELADYLRAHPDRRIALVGHTDSSGALDINITISKQRAGSVLERLVSDHGIPRRQLAAEGMGYLAPVASNLTPEGREANRRVEAIVISTE